MKGFKFNVEEAIGRMENSVVIGRMTGELSVGMVVCINEDHVSSHGGHVIAVIDGELTEASVNDCINKTVAAAMDQNEFSPEDNTCRYVPIMAGIPPKFLEGLARQLFGHPSEADAPLILPRLGEEPPAGE